MIVRKFLPEDARRCCEIINACVVVMDGLNEAARAFLLAKNTSDVLTAELTPLDAVVGVENEIVIGVGALDVTAGEIKRVYVDPAQQSQGTGGLIMQTLEARAKALNVSTIRVQASPNAVKFYEGCGYRATGTDSLSVDTALFEYVNMTKTL